MANPRSLRRVHSEDEEGDVFDDKSEISTSSDEEENTADREEDAGPEAGGIEKKSALVDPRGQTENKNKADTEEEEISALEPDPNIHKSSQPERICRGRGADKANRRSTWQLMQEDPSYVPRGSRYFLHDDRRDGDDEDQKQAVSEIPQATQMRVGPCKKLWTPDENEGEWKHDKWDELQREECRPRQYSGKRGGAPWRGRRQSDKQLDSWEPFTANKTFPNSNAVRDDNVDLTSQTRSRRPRFRGRGRGVHTGPRQSYQPKQNMAA